MRYLQFYQSLVTLLWLLFAIPMVAQLPIYNSDFKYCKGIQTKGELADSLGIMGIVDRSYQFKDAMVIEYYEISTARFVGFAGDTTQFDLRKLPYLSRTPMMRRLVKQFGPATAHDIRQGMFVPGMLQKDIIEIHGWPRERSREKRKSVWTYDDFILTFNGKVLEEFMKTGS